jgi:preprotein translocase subunit SecG
MYALLIVIHVFVSIVLVAVILFQAGRGGGLSEFLGGQATQTIFGQKTSTFLARATSVCAALFIITSLSLTLLAGKRSKSLMEGVGKEEAKQEAPATAPAPAASEAKPNAPAETKPETKPEVPAAPQPVQ